MEFEFDLTRLANEAHSDKGNMHFAAHDYAKYYSFLFEEFRNDTFSMLEMGLCRADKDVEQLLTRTASVAPSASIWLKYFPNAFLYGFDISDFQNVKLDRFQFIRGDMGSLSDLEHLRTTLKPLRIIIDDASHAAYHQQLALIKLFPLLESGGIYVIEDVHSWSPIEQQLPQCLKTREVIEKYLATKKLDIPFATAQEIKFVEENIRKIYVHRNDRGGVPSLYMKLVAFERK